METATSKRSKVKQDVTVLLDYDVVADAKNRISLRGANAKYFHVLALSNGSYMLEPRVLVPPDAVPARTLKMLNRSLANLKKGKVSPPIDLSFYQKEVEPPDAISNPHGNPRNETATHPAAQFLRRDPPRNA